MAYILWAVMVLISAWIPAPPLESEPAILNTFFISIHSMFSNKYLLFFSAVPAGVPRCHRCLPGKNHLSWLSEPQKPHPRKLLFSLFLYPAFLWRSGRSADSSCFPLPPGR